MAERRVKVVFSAEIQNFKSSMEAAAQATSKAKKASEDAGKASDKAAEDIQKQALAHHKAAKAAGLQYDNTGQLVTMNGKAVSSQQAATHGLETFSKEAYLAGRAAVAAGEDAEAAAKVAAEAQEVATKAAEKHKAALEEVGRVAAIGGALVLAGVGMAVKSYADFDKQMSSVDAATHETAKNMALLRQAAIDAGADTAFSAVEAGQGIEELSKAGVSTRDILGGGLKGSLDLAAAGALGVGEAAEISASALTQFKLSGDKVPHLADLLAAGAGKAQGSVHDLGEALNQSGLVAAQTGLTIEETTGGLAAFASAGLTGSDAGTSFKTMLMALTPNSKEAAKLMDDLGLSAYDSQGKFIGLSEYAGVLQGSLKDMSDEQRNATLKTIFGSDAIRAASVLYEQGADGVQKWEDAVNDSGYAAETASRMQNNLAGDLEKLGGSFDTVLLQSGSGANEVLRGLVQNLEGVVDAVGKVPAPVLSAVTGVAALAGGAALLGGGLITVIPKIKDTKDAIDTLAPSGSKARDSIDKVGKAAGLAATALVTLQVAGAVSKIFAPETKSIEDYAQALVTARTSSADLDAVMKNTGGLGTQINGVGDALVRVNDFDWYDNLNNWAGDLVGGTSKTQQFRDSVTKLDGTLGGLVQGGSVAKAGASFKTIAEEADKSAKAQGRSGMSTEEVLKLMPQYTDALKAQGTALELKLSDEELHDLALGKIPARMEAAAKATDGQAKAIEGAGKAAEDAGPSAEELAKQLEDVGLNADGSVANLDKFTQALVNAGLLTLSSRDATAKFDEALDGLKGKIDTIMATEQAHGGVLNETKTDLDLYSEAGRAANDVLADMTQKGFGAAEAMAKNGASMPEVQTQLGKTYDAMVTTARGFGLGKEEAEALTRSILHVPPGVDVNTWMSDEAKRMAEGTKKAIDDIPKDVTITTVEHNIKILETQVRGGSDGIGDDVSLTALKPGGFTGGRVRELMGFAEGGIVPGSAPSDPSVDNVLAVVNGQPLKVRSGEWIINEGSSRSYDRELAAINAGTFPKMPGYANGARVGREYSAQSFGYQPAGGAGNVSVSAPAVTVMIGNEQLDSRMYRVAGAALSEADSNTTRMRRGRG